MAASEKEYEWIVERTRELKKTGMKSKAAITGAVTDAQQKFHKEDPPKSRWDHPRRPLHVKLGELAKVSVRGQR
jgi:hypothetical protein